MLLPRALHGTAVYAAQYSHIPLARKPSHLANPASICCTASASSSNTATTTPSTPAPPTIRAIVTDVDGTLLNSSQQLTQRTVDALNAAVDSGIQLVLATGKARGPWLQDVAPRLQLHGPTVFLQGVLLHKVLDATDTPHTQKQTNKCSNKQPLMLHTGLLIYGNDGSVLHSRALPADVCHAALEFAAAQQLIVTVYSDDRIVCDATNDQTDRLLFYR